MLIVCLAVATLLAAGCASTPTVDTASGRPEVIIQGVSSQHILSTAKAFFVNRGYAVLPTDNGNKLSFSRRSEKPGGPPSKSDCWRVHLALAELSAGSYRLTGTPTKVEGCGGELESEHVMPVGYPQIQTLLREIQAQCELTK